MKKYKSKTSNINKTRQKKRDAILYKYFMATIAICVIHYIFIAYHYLGSDYRYDLFVFWIPTLIGIIITIKFDLLQFDWKDFIPDLKKEKNFFRKVFTIPFLILVHFMFSVIMFWMPSNVIWDIVNKIEAHNNRVEVFTLKVEKFYKASKGSDKIYFKFKNESESVSVKYQDIKPYLDKNPSNYSIKLEVRKGIWNYYIIDSYDIL